MTDENQSDKQLNISVKILDGVCKLSQRMEALENKITIIVNESIKIQKAKEIIDRKGFVTKKELLDELGAKSWKAWQDIRDMLETENYVIISGYGRAETMIVTPDESKGIVSISAAIFKKLKNHEEMNIPRLTKQYPEKAVEIYETMIKMFPNRIKRAQGIQAFKKVY